MSSEALPKLLSDKRALTVINAVLFQCAWFVFILAKPVFVGITLGIFLFVHYWLFNPSKKEWAVIVFVGVWGALVDSMLIAADLLPLEPMYIFSFTTAPFWLVSLWLAFAMTLHHSLRFLQSNIVLAAALAAIAAPWAYYVGGFLRGVVIPWSGLVAIAIVWACWLPLATRFIAKAESER